jgi:hypothetical protein
LPLATHIILLMPANFLRLGKPRCIKPFWCSVSVELKHFNNLHELFKENILEDENNIFKGFNRVY